MSPRTSAADSSASSNSASTTTASGCTGPPTCTQAPGSTRSSSGGTASATAASVGRLSTSPIDPSSECSVTSTTARRKFGSRSAGEAIRSWPRSDSCSSTSGLSGRRPARGSASRRRLVQLLGLLAVLLGEVADVVLGFLGAQADAEREEEDPEAEGADDREVPPERDRRAAVELAEP